MSGRPHVPSFKSFVISARVRAEVAAQVGKTPQPIPVIISLRDSKEHPDSDENNPMFEQSLT